jgi:hypothetical protein
MKKVENSYSKTIFLAIAFGTGVRDVLRNDTFKLIKENKEVRIVVFSQDISEEFTSEFSGPNVFFEKLFPTQINFIERFLLHFQKALIRKKSKTIDLGSVSGETLVLNLLTPIANLSKLIFGKRLINKFLYFSYSKFAPAKQYKREFELYSPDLVVVTRVLSYSMDYPIARMASMLNVPTVTLVSSWDNLTSKGFYPFGTNRLVVWNDVIKEEAISLFDFPESKISVTGMPRNDLFFRYNEKKTKTNFCEENGLNPNLKIITYCTGSRTLGITKLDSGSPEPLIVEIIAKAIDNLIIPNCQLLLRFHPQANIEEYSFLDKFSSIVFQVPGKKSSFQDRLFSSGDDLLLIETMKFSDVVVNYASTITIDAAIFNKPIICPNFDVKGERPYKYSMKRLYEFDHYSKLLKNGGISLPINESELIESILTYLQNPNIDSEGRKAIVAQQCFYKDGFSGKRVADAILSELWK